MSALNIKVPVTITMDLHEWYAAVRMLSTIVPTIDTTTKANVATALGIPHIDLKEESTRKALYDFLKEGTEEAQNIQLAMLASVALSNVAKTVIDHMSTLEIDKE